MNFFLLYLQAFVVGGIICIIGQVLINTTKLTASRILIIFLLLGVFLEAAGLFQPIKEFGQAGATVPIVGFGANLARGGIQGALERGFIGAITGGVQSASAGLAGVIVIGFVVAVFARSKTK